MALRPLELAHPGVAAALRVAHLDLLEDGDHQLVHVEGRRVEHRLALLVAQPEDDAVVLSVRSVEGTCLGRRVDDMLVEVGTRVDGVRLDLRGAVVSANLALVEEVEAVVVLTLDEDILALGDERAGRPAKKLGGRNPLTRHGAVVVERVVEHRAVVDVTAALVDEPLAGELVHVGEELVLDMLLRGVEVVVDAGRANLDDAGTGEVVEDGRSHARPLELDAVGLAEAGNLGEDERCRDVDAIDISEIEDDLLGALGAGTLIHLLDMHLDDAVEARGSAKEDVAAWVHDRVPYAEDTELGLLG
mmetsp:Transcript_2660/g.5559  ORF Transcript_2660/g.5559 Transcript_2660/m.5559 type:complete len:303 (+) Transcript_2660:2827-3735(+)